MDEQNGAYICQIKQTKKDGFMQKVNLGREIQPNSIRNPTVRAMSIIAEIFILPSILFAGTLVDV